MAFSPLAAQDADTEGEAAAEAEEEIITLQEFRVDTTQEYGYRATSSMTAIRLTGQVIDTPMRINILPEEFLEDLAFDSTQEASRYISGIYGDERVSSHDGGGTLYVRGFRTPKQRNGVESFGPSNLNGVDRIEVIKGPVGVFYGNTAPGGIYNVVTKKPEFINAGSLKYTYGSYNHHTVSADVQATALENTLGVRVNGTYMDSDDWRDFEKAKETYLTASVRWRPRPRIDMFYEYENAEMLRNDGVNDNVENPRYHAEYANVPQNMVDFFRVHDTGGNVRTGLDVDGNVVPVPLASDEETISVLRNRWRVGAVNKWKADVETATGEYVLRFTGHGDPFDLSPRGYKFNRNGEGGFDNFYGKSHLFNVSWGPTSWIDVRYQFYDIESERIYLNNFYTDANGDYTVRMRTAFNGLSYSRRINQQADIRFTFNTESVGQHKILAGHEHQHNFRTNKGTHSFDWDQLPDVLMPADPLFRGGPIAPGTEMVLVKGSEYYNAFNPYIMDVPNYTDAIASRSYPTPKAPSWLNSYYTTHLGSFFNNRLRTMIGMRWEEEDDGDTGQTPSYGAVFEIAPGWHLFGNYSEQWRPNGDSITGAGVVASDNAHKMVNEMGQGYDFGVKSNWRDNTLSGSISWFTLDRANIRQQDGDRNDTDPRRLDDDTGNNITWWILSGLEHTEGFESDLVWTPNPNFQLLFSYSWTYDAKIVHDASLTNPVEIAIQNGRQLHNAPEHNLAIFGKQSFREGKLKGFSFGLGFRATSEAESGNNKPFRFHQNPGYSVWDGLIQYETNKIGKRTVFSFNMENMFDQRWWSGLAVGDPFKAYFKIKTFF
jgi:outer membrane receptor protein involved in Fe transport